MKKIQKIFFLLIFTVTPTYAFAQIISGNDIQVIQEHARCTLKEFLSYYNDIGNTSLTEKQRKVSMQAALALFIGNGDSYYIKNEFGGKKSKTVRIQIVSSNNPRKVWRNLKSYLNSTLYIGHIYDILAVDIIATNKIPGTDKTITHLMKLDANGLNTNYSIIVPEPPLEAKRTTSGYTWSIKLGDITINRKKDY